MTQIKDFDIRIKLRNNQIVERRERLGLSAPRAAEKAGVSYFTWLKFENLQGAPFSKRQPDKVSMAATKICDFLHASPEDLWPEQMLHVRRSMLRRRFDAEELRGLIAAKVLTSDDSRLRALPPGEELEHEQLKEHIVGALGNLSPREAMIITRRFGLHGDEAETYEALAERLGLGRERVRQIAKKAMSRLRYHDSVRSLKPFVEK